MKTIIFSLTCHENIECIVDLINNIIIHSNNFKYYILISTIEKINNDLKIYNLNNVIVVNVRNNNSNIWANIELFYQHILNAKYLSDNNIDFDYFWFIASNEYFIKNIDEDFLNKYVIKITGKKDILENYDTYFNNFINNHDDWNWYNEMRKDKYTMNFFKNNNLLFYNIPHEGLVLTKNIIYEIKDIYLNSKINENSTYKKYCMEEIFPLSYLMSKYHLENINLFCNRFYYNKQLMNDYKSKNFDNLYDTFMNQINILTIKPVYRKINDPFRIYLKNKINAKLNNFILNKYNFKNNIMYLSINQNSNILIDNNEIILKKINPYICDYVWIGYDINGPFSYNLSFDIFTDKNINNFNFIKLHNPVNFLKINQYININEWTYIEINFNIQSPEDLCIFIFDTFKDTINLKFKNINFKKNNINNLILNEFNFENNIDDFVVNKYNFVKNITNFSKNKKSTILIDENNEIYFSKIDTNKYDYAWFGYDIKGKHNYTICFDIFTDKNINNFNFIKLHNPVNFLKTNIHIKSNDWTYIEINFNVFSELDLLIFIFDDFIDTINIKIKNVKFEIKHNL